MTPEGDVLRADPIEPWEIEVVERCKQFLEGAAALPHGDERRRLLRQVQVGLLALDTPDADIREIFIAVVRSDY